MNDVMSPVKLEDEEVVPVLTFQQEDQEAFEASGQNGPSQIDTMEIRKEANFIVRLFKDSEPEELLDLGDKTTRELVLLRRTILLMGDYYVLYMFFYYGRKFHGMETDLFTLVWGTLPYLLSWTIVNKLFREKSAYGNICVCKVEHMRILIVVWTTLKCTFFFVPLGTIFHAFWRLHFMLHVFTTFMFNAYMFMSGGIIAWRVFFYLLCKIFVVILYYNGSLHV